MYSGRTKNSKYFMHLKIENKNEIKIKFNNNIYTGILMPVQYFSKSGFNGALSVIHFNRNAIR